MFCCRGFETLPLLGGTGPLRRVERPFSFYVVFLAVPSDRTLGDLYVAEGSKTVSMMTGKTESSWCRVASQNSS